MPGHDFRTWPHVLWPPFSHSPSPPIGEAWLTSFSHRACRRRGCRTSQAGHKRPRGPARHWLLGRLPREHSATLWTRPGRTERPQAGVLTDSVNRQTRSDAALEGLQPQLQSVCIYTADVQRARPSLAHQPPERGEKTTNNCFVTRQWASGT